MGFFSNVKRNAKEKYAEYKQERSNRRTIENLQRQEAKRHYQEGFEAGRFKAARREGYEAGSRRSGGSGFEGFGREILGNIATAGREAGGSKSGGFGFNIPKNQGFTINPTRRTGTGWTGFGAQQPRRVHHRKVHHKKGSSPRKGKTIVIRL